MVNYNMPQIDVWGSFAQGMEIGGALRRRQQQDAYGDAYQTSGWEGVRDAAGGFGDLETAQGAQGVMNDAEETALSRAQRSAQILGNAATSLQGVPYEQRMATLQQWAPMLQGLGIDEQQLSQFDPTDENLEMIRGIQGQFSQYAEIRQQGDAIVGVRPDGSVEVLRQEQPDAPSGYRFTPGGDLQHIPGGPADPAIRAQQQGGQPGAGRPPSGYRWTPDGQGLEAIPGGPAEARVNNAERQRIGGLMSRLTNNQIVMDNIQSARALARGNTGMGSIMAGVPGTGARDLQATLDTIRANIGFDALNEMRMNSPTGGALGQVTERELAFLQAVMGSLDQSQSTERFLQNLDRLEREYAASMARIRAAFEQDFGAGGGAPAQAPDVSGGIESLSDEQLDQLEQELMRGQ